MGKLKSWTLRTNRERFFKSFLLRLVANRGENWQGKWLLTWQFLKSTALVPTYTWLTTYFLHCCPLFVWLNVVFLHGGQCWRSFRLRQKIDDYDKTMANMLLNGPYLSLEYLWMEQKWMCFQPNCSVEETREKGGDQGHPNFATPSHTLLESGESSCKFWILRAFETG